MPDIEFLTVPDELLSVARSVYAYLATYGYTIKVEKRRIEQPYAPTMQGRRSPTALIVEVVDRVPHDRVREWVAFAKSAASDTRVALAMPPNAMAAEDFQVLQELGVGVLIADAGVTELLPPKDQAVNIGLPSLHRYPTRVRQLLGPAFEMIDRGEWREGFAEACQALEVEARRYLKKHCASGRIKLLRPSGSVYSPTPQQIERMTLGGITIAFERIQLPNAIEVEITAVLKRLNPDRIKVVHKKRQAEMNLRRNAGRQIWAITSGLDALTTAPGGGRRRPRSGGP